MGGFLGELRRRHIFRIGAVYVVVAWGIVQVLDVLSQLFALPDWVAQPAVVVLAIGFPVTLIAAWMIVGAADGGDPARSLKATGTDWLIGGGLIAVLLAIGYQQFASRADVVANDNATSANDEIVQTVGNRLPNSIAVLPFENLSPDPDNAYFAAGIHDEIISHLAKIRDLSVIARMSVMEYPDSGMSIPEIADELNVEMIMEGSVRYAGDAIRVTAQLIDGLNNTHLWTETYDGDLSDIFGIQADIATRVAMALEAELLPRERAAIEQQITQSTEAYAAYLRAKSLVPDARRPGGSPAERALIHNYLDVAVGLDPNFSEAYTWKAFAYLWERNFNPVNAGDWEAYSGEVARLAEENGERALSLNPNSGLAHAALSQLYMLTQRFNEAEENADQAIALEPNDVDIIGKVSEVEVHIRGRPDNAVALNSRAVQLDPKNPEGYLQLAYSLQFADRYAESLDAAQGCLEVNPDDTTCMVLLARAERALGRDGLAAGTLQAVEQLLQGEAAPSLLASVGYGYGLLGQFDDAQRIMDVIRRRAEDEYVDPVAWTWAYFGIGDYDAAREQLELAARSPSSLRSFVTLQYTALNFWSDPILNEPDWVEFLTLLRPR